MSQNTEALKKINQFLFDLKKSQKEVGTYNDIEERAGHTALILAGLSDVVEAMNTLQETSNEILKALQFQNKVEELKISSENTL